jgi:hypothetical protein
MLPGAIMRRFFLKMHAVVFAAFIIFAGCTPRTKVNSDRPESKEALSVYIPPDENTFCNPSKMHFSVKKYKDVSLKNVGTVTALRFVVRGAKPEQKYVLWCQSLGRDVKPVYEYESDDRGLLGRQIGQGTMMLDDDMLLMFDFFKGEPVKYYLTSFDKDTVLQAEFVPYPLSVEAKDEAIVTIKRLVPNASLVLCEGEGFLPDEHLLITTQSGTTIVANTPFVCRNGKFSFIFEPEVPHKSGGTGYVEVRRFSERLVLDCDWGCEAFSKKKIMARSESLDAETLLQLNSSDKNTY